MSIVARPKFAAVAASVAVAVIVVAGLVIDNPGEVSLKQGIRPLIVLVSAAIVIPLILFSLGKRTKTVGFCFPILLFLFFKFNGFLSVGLVVFTESNFVIWTAGVIFAIICGMIVAVFSQKDPAKTMPVVLGISIAACVGSMGILAAQQITQTGINGQKDSEKIAAAIATLTEPIAIDGMQAINTLPDIIYIVPDRYGNEKAMSELYGVDVQSFRMALEGRGFYVAKNARANYAKTFQSLASSLNMKMLDPITSKLVGKAADRRPLFELLRNNAVQKSLHSMGYKVVHLGSWWDPTRFNPNADVNFYGAQSFAGHFSEFERALLAMTPVEWLGSRDECKRLQAQLKYLKSVRSRSKKPVFVFAHLTLPHPPITMSAAGECIPHVSYAASKETKWTDHRDAFKGYVEFANRTFLEIFDANVNADTDRDMMFAIQADEGPYPQSLQRNDDQDMHLMAAEKIRTKFGIINAIYWDKDKYGSPYLTQTPVNNWRIIFSEITGVTIPLINEEKSLLMRSEAMPYDLKDVTGVFAASIVNDTAPAVLYNK